MSQKLSATQKFKASLGYMIPYLKKKWRGKDRETDRGTQTSKLLKTFMPSETTSSGKTHILRSHF